jgi:hypothetical protein
MSYSTWADFVYYQVGGIAEYNTIAYQALTANRDVIPTSSIGTDWSVLPSGGGGGVSSLVGGTGALTMSSGEATFTLAGNDIQMAIAFPIYQLQYGTFLADTTNNISGPFVEYKPFFSTKGIATPNIGVGFGFGDTNIVLAVKAVYKVSYSVSLFNNSPLSDAIVNVYLILDGVAVDDTNTEVRLGTLATNPYANIFKEYYFSCGDGSTIGLGANADVNTVFFQKQPAVVGPPPIPLAPSIVFNIQQMSGLF